MEKKYQCMVCYHILTKPQKFRGACQKSLARQILEETFFAFFGVRLQWDLIKRSAHGKPCYDSPDPYYFNISHCDTAIAVAVARVPVGIDVEGLRRVKCSVVKKCCSAAETEYVYGTENLRSFGKEELCEDEAKRFLHLWTLKESYVKMTGEGMRVPFDTVCFDMGGFRETEHGILQSEKAGQHKACLFVQKDTAMALALKDDSADKGTDVIWLPYSSAGF